MEIHKPKPVHSLREFLSEILVVVIGISIALGGEQLIDWLHWRHELAETRQALVAELSANLRVVADVRRERVCEKGLLGTLEAWAKGPETPENPARGLRGSGLPALQTSAWEVAKTGQGAARMRLEERLALGRIYNQVDEVNSVTAFQRQSTMQLLALMDRKTLTTAQRERMLDYVTQERLLGDIWVLNATAFETLAKNLGAKPPPPAAALKFPADCQVLHGLEG